jgi:hypothetical protein
MKQVTVLVGLVLLMLVAGVVMASGPAAIDRHVTSGGGGHTQAGAYSLDTVFGQAVVGLDRESAVELCSGFRCLPVEVPDLHHILLPLVLRGYP